MEVVGSSSSSSSSGSAVSRLPAVVLDEAPPVVRPPLALYALEVCGATDADALHLFLLSLDHGRPFLNLPARALPKRHLCSDAKGNNWRKYCIARPT